MSYSANLIVVKIQKMCSLIGDFVDKSIINLNFVSKFNFVFISAESSNAAKSSFQPNKVNTENGSSVYACVVGSYLKLIVKKFLS